MDKFGFNKVANAVRASEQVFLQKGVQLAREEMISNIALSNNQETGESYPPLSYREEPPQRLVLTGELLREVESNPIRVSGNHAVLTIDPIDERGRGYASYHEEGENQYKSKSEFQAEFVTQSSELAQKQINLLESLINSSFNSR